MGFAEAKAVAAKNPGAVLTRDSNGDHIVKNREGELLYSPTQVSRSDEAEDLSQPKSKEPAVMTGKRLLDPFVTALNVGVSDLNSKSVDPLLEQTHQVFLETSFKLEGALDDFSEDEKASLEKYGSWMNALMTGHIQPTTDEHRAFVSMCQGKTHPSNELARLWQRYQVNCMYLTAVLLDKHLGAAKFRGNYQDVVQRFATIAEQGHQGAIDWLKNEGPDVYHSSSKRPPCISLLEFRAKKPIPNTDLFDLGMASAGGFGTNRRH